jgi:hypothetical protein
MIKIKNKEIDSETIESLNELIKLDINALAAFKLMKIIKSLATIVDNRKETELNLVKRYAKTDADGEIIVPKNEEGEEIQGAFEIEDTDQEKFNEEMVELLDYENELAFDAISFEDLKLETISINNLMKLDFLFV